MRGGDAPQPRGDAVHVVDAHDDELGHVEFELAVDFHEGEDAAVDVVGELAAQVVECFEVPLDRVVAREENGVVAPADALGSDDSLELVQRLDGVVDRRNARFDVSAVGGDGVLEVRVEPVGYRAKVRQERRVVFRAELYDVDERGVELVARDLVREQRVARQSIAFFEAFEQPRRIPLHRVRPRSRVDDHASSGFSLFRRTVRTVVSSARS